jgi:hypothetical protein
MRVGNLRFALHSDDLPVYTSSINGSDTVRNTHISSVILLEYRAILPGAQGAGGCCVGANNVALITSHNVGASEEERKSVWQKRKLHFE